MYATKNIINIRVFAARAEALLLSAQFLLLTNLQRKLTQDGINHPTEFSLSMQYPGYDGCWIANERRG